VRQALQGRHLHQHPGADSTKRKFLGQFFILVIWSNLFQKTTYKINSTVIG
jgi:hypothetical protein